jgi:hypothetical protein
MQNFYELTDIDPKITIVIKLRSLTNNGVPRASVRINNVSLFDNDLAESVAITHQIDLLSKFELVVSMSGKQYNAERETAVIIDSVTIDDFNIVPQWTNLIEYRNERNLPGATSYLGFNGDWILNIDQPFYQWRHHVTGQGWLLEPNNHA